MSRRTSEANRAIVAAWLNEQRLVREGKGTRDWSLAQQQDILDRGRAYDSNGKAFEGHHMKSAEKFPEYQGDSGNIQFLSRPEHLTAHKGCFQNPTNGYFNPCTGEIRDFGVNIYESCEIIYLSEPVIQVSNKVESIGKNIDQSVDEIRRESTVVHIRKSDDSISAESRIGSSDSLKMQKAKKVPPDKGSKKSMQSVGKTFASALKFVVEAIHKHPKGTIIISTVSMALIKIIKDGDYRPFAKENDVSIKHNEPSFNQDSFRRDDVSIASGEAFAGDLERSDRASPREHSVSGYDRQQNGKTVHVNPYTRGKSKDD